MELFLLRHGDAVYQAPRDELRPLSSIGVMQVKSMMQLCQTELHSVGRILVSPYLRCQQTYEAAQKFLPNVTQQNCNFLTPSSNPNFVIDQLYTLTCEEGVSSVLVISHQPLLGNLLALLCALEPGVNEMGTSSLAAIDLEVFARSMGKLRWLKHPEAS